MTNDYNYKLYPEVEKQLIEKNYKKIEEEPSFWILNDRYENWTNGDTNILLQVFTNDYVAIFKESENI
jgi:hypothetical protein